MHSAKSVANFFLEKAKADGIELTQMKLHKLIYFAHGWHLALVGEPLISEPVKAWRHGPVIDSVYQEFKHFGSKAITEKAFHIEFSDSGQIEVIEFKENFSTNTRSILEQVYQIYKNFSATELREMTHAVGSPWHQYWKDGNSEFGNVTIPNDAIKTYFETLKKRGN